MIKFYFQYDKDRHKAKFVIVEESGHEDVYFVDKVICHCMTETNKQDQSPKFVVTGQCEKISLVVEKDYSSIRTMS